MRCTILETSARSITRNSSFRSAIGVLQFVLIAVSARAQAPVKAYTDNIDYNVGSAVQLKVIFAPPGATIIKATIRYAGDTKPVLDQVPLANASASPKDAHPTGYRHLWQIPASARTGRYFIDLTGLDAKSRQPAFSLQNAASFVVYKKLVRVESIKLDKTFYSSGDPVSASFTIANVSHRPLTGLRVEFSNRYWPWIAGPADAARASVVTLDQNLTLPAGGKKTFHAARVEVADDVKQPSTHQYGVVVWDHARKSVLDISFSPLAIIQPPGASEPKPFSGWYLYPALKDVNTESYRRFYPAGLESPAIQFDRSHTMFPTGGEAEAEFTVKNPTDRTWKGISIRYHVIGPGGDQLSQETAAGPIDLEPGASSDHFQARFSTAPDAAGLYQVKAEVVSGAGNLLGAETLELGVNPLPKSILIFCAHEDDEGGYSGLTRAAIENHIPVHYVYFTSGDAGSCDVYYQHSCSPADALNFGGIRMDEVRASLGHLGVPREDILFIGLPDGGSGKIWYDHVMARDPFLDPLLATDHAPYDGLVEPNIPYARESVVEAVEGLIRKFQPEIIATPHPGSVGHIDHIVNNYLVVKALQALAREGTVSPRLPVLVNPVHDPKTQPFTPYRYKDLLFHVSGDVAALAQETWWFYMSQGGSRAEGNIRPYDKLPRTEAFRQLLDWNEHEGWNDKRAPTSP
ncbi:MAG TPA: PIG-L family deacetylase [Terriglobia bacterium]|nr:PIG-L family deacetylase [Terriglobia bacterium]